MKKTISFLVLYFTLFITNAAIASESAGNSGAGAFLPLIIIYAIFYWSLVKPINKRKGKSRMIPTNVLRQSEVSLTTPRGRRFKMGIDNHRR